MHSRVIASLFALCLLTSSAPALQDGSAFPIDYPLKGYRLTADATDSERRAADLRRLPERLTRSTSTSFSTGSDRLGGTSVVTGLHLDRRIPPIRILWNDPRFLFRPAVVVEWIERVDERGRVSRVWVTASNVSPTDDARIIGWCTNDALWQPVEIDGSAPSILRTAGVTLIGSPYHYSTWKKKLRTGPGLLVAFALVAIVLWLVGRVMGYRRQQRVRHEQMMIRLHRASPYKPPSVDDEM